MKICGLSFILFQVVTSVFAQPPEKDAIPLSAEARGLLRLEVLKNANHSDWIVVRRAIQEMPANNQIGVESLSELIRVPNRLKDSDRGILEVDNVNALASLATTHTDELVSLLKDEDSNSESFKVGLLALGQMGRNAASAIPFLERISADEHLEAQTKVELRICLANIGENSKENLAQIVVILKRHDDLTDTALWTMAVTRSRDWPSPGILDQLKLCLQTAGAADGESVSRSPLAAVIFGNLGTNAAVYARVIQSQLKTAKRTAGLEAARIIYNLALARIETHNQQKYVLEVLKLIGRDFGRAEMAALLLGSFLVDDHIVEMASDAFDKGDVQVRLGICHFCQTIGYSAHLLSGKLILTVQKLDNEDLRLAAAKALGPSATYMQMSSLQRLFKTEASSEVKKALEASVQNISLGNKK